MPVVSSHTSDAGRKEKKRKNMELESKTTKPSSLSRCCCMLILALDFLYSNKFGFPAPEMSLETPGKQEWVRIHDGNHPS